MLHPPRHVYQASPQGEKEWGSLSKLEFSRWKELNWTVGTEFKRGGFGQVFFAKDPEGNEFALKFLLPDKVHREQELKDEGELQKDIHKGMTEDLMKEDVKHEVPIMPMEHFVAGYFPSIRSDPLLGIAMRKLPGSVRNVMRMTEKERAELGLPPDIRIRVGRDLLDLLWKALSWLHEQGFGHADLKLDNILVQPDGTVMLTDFGSARKFPESHKLKGWREDVNLENNYAIHCPGAVEFLKAVGSASKKRAKMHKALDYMALTVVCCEFFGLDFHNANSRRPSRGVQWIFPDFHRCNFPRLQQTIWEAELQDQEYHEERLQLELLAYKTFHANLKASSYLRDLEEWKGKRKSAFSLQRFQKATSGREQMTEAETASGVMSFVWKISGREILEFDCKKLKQPRNFVLDAKTELCKELDCIPPQLELWVGDAGHEREIFPFTNWKDLGTRRVEVILRDRNNLGSMESDCCLRHLCTPNFETIVYEIHRWHLDPNLIGTWGPLLIAIRNEWLECNSGADERTSLELTQLLMASGLDLNQRDQSRTSFKYVGGTSVHYVCVHGGCGSEKPLSKLLELGADANIKTACGKTPLAQVCFNFHNLENDFRLEMMSVLLSHGADPNAAGSDGRVPLCLLLEDARWYLRYQKERQDKEFYKKECEKRMQGALQLLDHGADPNLIQDDNLRRDLLEFASQHGHRLRM